MRRPAVSVVLIPSGTAEDLQAGLGSLRPQLGVHDEVLAVTTPSAGDHLRPVLRAHRFVRDLGSAGEAGDAAAAADIGAAAARHDIVVLIDGDTLLGAHCLDAVAAQFHDPEVVAAGPRCHWSYGPQSVHLPPAEVATPAAFQARARSWRQEQRGRAEQVDGLGRVFVAVRRTALQGAGGFSAGEPWRAVAERGRIVVVHEALASHVGGEACVLHDRSPEDADAPLLSASLIVKDEEEVLADCLRSLEGLVDEIVVYDTGSTDRTKEIARAHGARVIDGYWDDSFGAARNRCLEHCHGRFVLVIDADEVAQADAVRLRETLAAAKQDMFHVSVDCLNGVGVSAPEAIALVRVFRRRRCCYAGRLHEQVVDRVLGVAREATPVTGLRLRHTGYLADRMASRDKARRNLALAEREAAEASPLQHELVLANRARSELLAGLVDECIATCREVLAGTPNPRVRRTTLATAAHATLARNAPAAEVMEWIDQLRAASSSSVRADHIEARLRYRDGDFAAVLALTDLPGSGVDEDGNGYDVAQVSGLRAQALHALGRHEEAAAAVLEAATAGAMELHVGRAAEILAAGGRGVDVLVWRLPDTAWKGVAVQTLQCGPDVSAAVLDAMWRQRPGDTTVLAAAAQAAHRMPVLTALEWSGRLRAHGAADDCPLVRLAGDLSRTARDRVVAAAVAFETFADERAYDAFAAALPDVADAEAEAVLAELRVLAPRLAAAVDLQPAG